MLKISSLRSLNWFKDGVFCRFLKKQQQLFNVISSWNWLKVAFLPDNLSSISYLYFQQIRQRCLLPIFPSTCNFPFLQAFWLFLDLVVLFLQLFIFFSFFLINMVHFYAKFNPYVMTLCIRVSNSYSLQTTWCRPYTLSDKSFLAILLLLLVVVLLVCLFASFALLAYSLLTSTLKEEKKDLCTEYIPYYHNNNIQIKFSLVIHPIVPHNVLIFFVPFFLKPSSLIFIYLTLAVLIWLDNLLQKKIFC